MNTFHALTRRRLLTCLGLAGTTAVASRAFARASESAPPHRIRAVAFDAFAIFDAGPVFGACESEFPGRGAELAAMWRTRLFEYQWLRALGGRYSDFGETSAAALVFACTSLGIELQPDIRDKLLQGFHELRPWPDVVTALASLRRRGLRTALLSNATPKILDAGVAASNLAGLFDHVISTDRVRTFKPHPKAYRLGVDVLRLEKQEILFVAFAGWDAAGARWFGYPTYWNNRLGAAAEELGTAPDASGATLDALARWLGTADPGS